MSRRRAWLFTLLAVLPACSAPAELASASPTDSSTVPSPTQAQSNPGDHEENERSGSIPLPRVDSPRDPALSPAPVEGQADGTGTQTLHAASAGGGSEGDRERAARGCDDVGALETSMGPAIALRVARYQSLVRKAAAESEIDMDLLNAVCFLESKFDARARRGKNKGLMQLGPGATSTMAAQLELRAAPYDPEFALRAGARLLARLIARYDGDVEWALVAYQRGVGGAAKIYAAGPVPEGQRGYVDRVLALREQFSESRWAARCVDPGQTP